MAKREINDTIGSIDELKCRFNLVRDDFRSHFGVSEISHVDIIDDILYLYFIRNDGSVTDRIHYKFIQGKSLINGDHVVKGESLTDLYKDLEFITVSYIFGIIC